MKFKLKWASDFRGEKYETVDVNTVEDFKALYDKYHKALILDFEWMDITVYDDYIE